MTLGFSVLAAGLLGAAPDPQPITIGFITWNAENPAT